MISLVVSTYDAPGHLEAVLRALSEQSDERFEVVVADDGSGPETCDLVERWRGVFGDRLTHVWQPDKGFRIARARNLGALQAAGDYLVFLDGDCVPRRNFVRAMRSAGRPGWFVAGRRLELSEALTARVLREQLPVHRWSFQHWLRARADVSSLRALTPRDRRRVGAGHLPEYVPHDRAYGYLLGVSRRDFELVEGYDTRFVGWGEEDVDIAVRLGRLGLRCGHAGSAATVMHLWHSSQKIPERANWWLLQETEQCNRVEAVSGLSELAAEPVRTGR